MLKNCDWFNYYNALGTELAQSKDEGRDIRDYEQIVQELRIERSFTPEDDRSVNELLDRIRELPIFGLLYGEKDFSKTIGTSVEMGFDADCNGATVGSIIGMMVGANAIPEQWVIPINDTLQTGISGYTTVKISGIARRTVNFLMK